MSSGGTKMYAYLAVTSHRQKPAYEIDNNVNFEPRYSPLHGHWIYAWLAATGRIESGRSADTTEPMFGVTVAEPVGPPRRQDTGFRHFWWRYVNDLWPGFPSGLVALALVLLALGGLGAGAVLLVRGTRHTANL